MNFIIGIFDKILFGALLLFFFQVPILADHYLQYISGYYQATEHQVKGFESNAAQHGYEDAHAMIRDLEINENPVVRTDAQQKKETLAEYEQLTQAINTLKAGNIYQRAWFMFNPTRIDTLKKVLPNFRPGVPLTLDDILFSVLTALALSIIILHPLRLLLTRRRAIIKPSAPTR